jgi:threonine aldolase
MRRAMAEAELGDDTYREDPSVRRLEARAAEILGHEAALLCISAHMANLVAALTHARPGDEVIADAQAHIVFYETGSLASVAGLSATTVDSTAGVMDPEALASAIRDPDVHYPRPRLLCLENTHNRSGGRVTPLERHLALCEVARRRGLAIHLDGARLFNAAVAAKVDASAYAAAVDSVTLSLTKGLSAPLGALLTGSRDFVEEARRARRRVGGGMRQAGVIAAAGLEALEMRHRLADDHVQARCLAEGLRARTPLEVDLDAVETNIVLADHGALGMPTAAVVGKLLAAGVVVSPRGATRLRLVTHRHIDAATVDEAVERIASALGQ